MINLYQHINFVDGGILKPNTKAQHSKQQYQLQFKQIVMPTYSPCWQYLIMHTPAIYNWLRTMKLNQDRINRYLKGQKPFAGIEKDPISKIKELAGTWDVVQISFLGKFYISKNHNKECHHLSKRNVNSLDYTYNYPKKQMFLEKYYCINCKEVMPVQASVKRYPLVVMLRRYEEKIFLDKVEYRLYLVIVNQNKNQALIKIANGAWYYVEANGTKIKNEAQIKTTKGELYFYHKVTEQGFKGGALKPAKPSIKQVPKPVQPHPTKMQVEEDPITENKHEDEEQKVYKPKFFNTDLKPIKQANYIPETYDDMPSYVKSVKSLYNKQKVKDKYDKEYDAGKVKKVKRKKMIHKIDFNKTQKQVKEGDIKVVNRKNKFRKQKHDRQL